MSKRAVFSMLVAGAAGLAMAAGAPPAGDVVPTRQGDLQITPLGHGTLMLAWNGVVIHVDPVPRAADYAALPAADIVLVTHEHGDHLDPAAIDRIRKPGTDLIYTAACAAKLPGGMIMANGDRRSLRGVRIEAVPAYNIVNLRSPGVPFHPRGSGNGYLLTFADRRVYVAGDSENTPEMKALRNLDVAFLPMNLPYTMTPEMVADAARSIRPRILYPYHYGDTDPLRLVALLKNDPEIEVRIRDLR
jgi:L-ascorbate metabolism protein UlaG (beta-lactamase superfamily)